MVINPAPSIIKRAYDGLALFCVLNMLAVGGLIAFLAGNGALDLEKFRRVVAVMRGEDLVPADDQAATSADAPSAGAASVSPGAPSSAGVAAAPAVGFRGHPSLRQRPVPGAAARRRLDRRSRHSARRAGVLLA